MLPSVYKLGSSRLFRVSSKLADITTSATAAVPSTGEMPKEPKEPKNRLRQSTKVLNSELLAGADYELDYEKGLRRVKPYYFTFKTYVKGRWCGKSLVEVFTTEFRDRDTDYYVTRHTPRMKSLTNEVERGNSKRARTSKWTGLKWGDDTEEWRCTDTYFSQT